jgi:CPA2 family monovalent cation:H+ antiporter-2
MLASHALLTMGVPLRKVVHRVQAARGERYASLRGFFHGTSDAADDDHLQLRLRSVALSDEAASIGQSLAELDLPALGAEVTTLRRGKTRIDCAQDTVLQAGDIIVLRGALEGLAKAEARLLKS